DPNSYDLAYVHASARWIMAELFSHATGVKIEEAGALIDLVHAPVGQLVEEIDGRLIAHGDYTVKEEILVLLHSRHPDPVPLKVLIGDMDRRNPKSVPPRMTELYDKKLIQGDNAKGYRLTSVGFKDAVAVIAKQPV